MTESLNKYIAFSSLSSGLEHSLGLSTDSALSIDSAITKEDNLLFACVGDHWGSYQELRQQLTEKNLQLPLLSLSPVEDRHDFVAAGGRAIIDENVVESPLGEMLLSRLVRPTSNSLHLEECYGEKLSQYKSIKITSVLGVGYYADILAYDAHQAGFDPVAVRSFVTHITTYYGYLVQADLARYPLEVEYGYSEDDFFLQFNVSVKNFVCEYLLESFTYSVSMAFPFKSLLALSLGSVDFLDITYQRKGEKLLIGGLWQKNRTERHFPSLLISEVDCFAERSQEVRQMLSNPKLALEQIQNNIPAINLPGGLNVLQDRESAFKRNPLLFARLVRYVQHIRHLDEEPIGPEKLEPEDIDAYLNEYPNQSLIDKLTRADKMAIIQALIDPASLTEEEVRIKGVTQKFIEENQLVKGGPEEDDYFEKIISSLDGMDQADLNEWVRGSFLEEEEVIRVKGTPEEEDKSATTIKGVTEVIKDDVWRVKSSGIKEELKKAVMMVRGSGGGIPELKTHFATILNQTLNVDEAPSLIAGENMLAQAIASFSTVVTGGEGGAGDSDMRIAKLLEELDYKNMMIEKLRKMVCALKVDTESAKSTEMVMRSLGDDKAGEAIDKMMAELRSAERNIKSRDQVIENLKLKLKRMGVVVAEKAASSDKTPANEAGNAEDKKLSQDYHKIKGLYQSTQAMLEVSNKKIALLTQELQEVNQHARGHDNVGMARLKDSLKNAQARLLALQKEKTELQLLLKRQQVDAQQAINLKDSIDRQQEHQEKREAAKLQEQEKLLERLKADLNAANEKHREALQKLNEQGRQVKAMEIQLKNSSSLEKKNEAKFATVASDEDKNAFKVKQLETVNERLEEANKKAQVDLNDKKKELMQMKAENTMLKNKLQALERKVMKR